MGIFSSASPFDADIDRVTDEKNTSDNWGLILDICDRASAQPKDALQSAVRRLNDRNPHVQLQTITLLDACVSNSGKAFHLEVSSREFETELRRLIVAASTHRRVKARLLSSLKKWAEGEFSSDSQLSMIPGLYRRLQAEGLYTLYAEDTSAASTGKTKPPADALSRDPNVVSSQQEQDDIAKAIALSMKEAERSPRRTSVASTSASATSSLYPSTSGPAAQPSQQLSSLPTAATNGAAVVERKVRALYDFEAAEDNELTFKTGEIILVTEDSDPNWWLGSNHRGRGLFPSNFVTSDLNQRTEEEPQQRKSVQFSGDVRVRTVEQGGAAPSAISPEPVVVDQARIGRLLHLLNEADPTGGRPDSEELLQLEEQCLAMGPLIDQELERIDRRHAQLTKISSELVEALNLYHQLMRDTPPPATSYYQGPLPPPGTNGYSPATAAGPYYGQPPLGAPQGYGMPPGPGPYMTGPYLPPQSPYMGVPPQQQLGPGQMDPSFYTTPAPPPVGMTQSGPPHQQQQWMPYTAPGAGAESQAPHQ